MRKTDNDKKLRNEKIQIIEEKEMQIKEILRDEHLTFGMALSVLNRVEDDIVKSGNTFLKAQPFRDVFP